MEPFTPTPACSAPDHVNDSVPISVDGIVIQPDAPEECWGHLHLFFPHLLISPSPNPMDSTSKKSPIYPCLLIFMSTQTTVISLSQNTLTTLAYSMSPESPKFLPTSRPLQKSPLYMEHSHCNGVSVQFTPAQPSGLTSPERLLQRLSPRPTTITNNIAVVCVLSIHSSLTPRGSYKVQIT